MGALVDATLGFHCSGVECLVDGLHCRGQLIKAGGQLCHLTLLDIGLLCQGRLSSALLVQELLKCGAELPRPFQHAPPSSCTSMP